MLLWIAAKVDGVVRANPIAKAIATNGAAPTTGAYGATTHILAGDKSGTW